ncbi:MAG TPA: hypothetical protein VFE62_09920 [Gemmataceae bacterium]|nr:hypothetical protein [Gemmataceae bacterium]
MQKVSIISCLALALLSSKVNADSIPWGYSASDAAIYNSNNASKSSSISFSGASGVATGSSGIIVYSVTASSFASDVSPDSFSKVPFDLAFKLTDVIGTGSKSASAVSTDTIHFTGTFSASNVTKSSLLPGLNSWTSNTTQVTLGGDDVGWRVYTVTFSSFTPPGQPGGSPGSVQAIVTVGPTVDGPHGSGEVPPGDPPPPTPHAAPEPATIFLGAVGALPLIIAIRRRTRNN